MRAWSTAHVQECRRAERWVFPSQPITGTARLTFAPGAGCMCMKLVQCLSDQASKPAKLVSKGIDNSPYA